MNNIQNIKCGSDVPVPMTHDEIAPYLKSCLCTTVPSEWYDNFPNVILESFAYKKAVIATDFGSLPELVKDGQTGLTFRYADVEDFRKKIAYMFEHKDEAQAMGAKAYEKLVTLYSPERHYEKVMKVLEKSAKQ